jgi:ABC-type uncharacterized transport system ATPase subunit
MLAVEVNHIFKSFAYKVTVNDLSFSIAQNEIFGLIGPNGVGKTTIVGMLTTLVVPTGDKAFVAGINVVAQPALVKQVVNGVFWWWLPEEETLENGYMEVNVNAIVAYEPPYHPEVGINRVQGVQCQVRSCIGDWSKGAYYGNRNR